jgi:dienelactone hydrolase
MRILFASLILAGVAVAADGDPKKPADRRLTTVRTLDDKDFDLKPPATLAAWKARRQAVREQVLVANGLWPMPARGPIEATIHGKIDRDGYAVEKVFFASMPGHYVTGTLYTPRDKDGRLPKGKLPGVLCPHGHWRNGRFYDAGEVAGKAQVAQKAEKTVEGGRYPLQARCAQLARMGCVVFHYDMVGYADSKAIPHLAFGGVEAELRLQSLMGLQTLNSLRALDFVAGLPSVDPKRIGVTGASGGGTQTFILGAIDDRPAVAFPAVMVSTQMQGGCVCENCSDLRVGTGNVELAALFAPKPMAMSGANDWTIHIERRGLPELKAVYKLYDAEDKVAAKCWPMFEHNYNQPAREMMYEWFDKHLELKQPTPIREKPFVPVPPAQLSVFDDQHPVPADSVKEAALRKTMTAASDKQIAALVPTDAKGLEEYRRVVGTALRVMTGTSLPDAKEIESKPDAEAKLFREAKKGTIGRRGQGEAVPYFWVRPRKFNGTVVVLVDPAGGASRLNKGKVGDEAQAILDGGAAVLGIDVLGTGELTFPKAPKVNPRFAGYTFGYNRPLLGQRVHDILTAIAFAHTQEGVKTVHLMGRGKAGPWTMLARAMAGESVTRLAADADHFLFERIENADDEMMLPGALKYGGMGALAGLAAPGEAYLHNHKGTGIGKWTKAAYDAAGASDKLVRSSEAVEEKKLIAWLLRP